MPDRNLLTESPIVINRELACAVGLNNAIVLKQIYYWTDSNQKNNREKDYQDGYWWCYNSYPKWQEKDFPFWNVDTIRAALNELEALRLVKTGNYNQRKGDNTKWYRVDWKYYDQFMQQWRLHHSPMCGNGKKNTLYKAFLENYQLTLATWDEMEASMKVSQATYESITGASMKVSQTVTKDYTENTQEENTFAPATQDAVEISKPKPSKPAKTPKPVHPLFGKDESGQNPFFNVILKHSFGGNGASAADARGNAGQVAKILKAFEPLYDELNGFTADELNQAYQQWLNQHPNLTAPRAPEKVYSALSARLRTAVTKRQGLLKIGPALQEVIKPRPSLTPDYIIKE